MNDLLALLFLIIVVVLIVVILNFSGGKNSKKSRITIMISVLLFAIIGCSETDNYSQDKHPEKNNGIEMLVGIQDEDLNTNIISAFKEVGIDYKIVKEIKNVGVWVGGDKLSFDYQGNSILMYVFNDNSINSINVGGVPVYKQGLQSLPVADYLISLDTTLSLKIKVENLVKDTLKYPNTAKFSSSEWGFSRTKDIYLVNGMVSAKNALDVINHYDIHVEYRVGNNETALEYFVLGGDVILGKSKIEKTNREEVIPENNDNKSEIELIDGVLGDYGKSVTEDGFTYIAYLLPEGNYIASTKMNFAVLYVEKKKATKNMDGYIEHEVVKEYRFEKGIQTLEIAVKNDEQVTITSSARITLTPKSK